MIDNPLSRSFLREPNPDAPSGGSGDTPPTPTPTAGPDLSAVTALLSSLGKSISDLKTGVETRFNNMDGRFKGLYDDLSEIAQTPSAAPHAPAPVEPTTPSPSPAPAPSPTNDAGSIAIQAVKRRLKEAEENLIAMRQENETTKRRERETRMVSTITQAMGKFNWADGSNEIVLDNFVKRAEIDDTGVVKISGEDPVKYIANWHAVNKWAQPPVYNVGSGAIPTRGSSALIDVANVDPVKLKPGTPEHDKYLAQLRKTYQV